MMLKKFLFFCVSLCYPMVAFCADGTDSVNTMLNRKSDNTKCAAIAFRQALANNANMIKVPDEADTTEIDVWAQFSFAQPETLRAVLNCPEIKQFDDDDTIIFDTVSYTFSNGRTIQINYETQKKVLKQKLLLADKKQGPVEVNPDIAHDAAIGNVWINVDPAWYAIMVAEHNSLKDFVGPDKNNILSADYIEQNITQFYPKDHSGSTQADCTSRSAYAGDTDMINRAVTITVGGVPPKSAQERKLLTPEEKQQQKLAKKNDYYVMGEANLNWVAASEITADVVLTIVTGGGYAAVKGGVQALRATRIFKQSAKALNTLKKSKDVARFIKTDRQMGILGLAIKNLDNIENITKLEHETTQSISKLEHTLEVLKSQKASGKEIAAIEKELETAKKQAEAIKKAKKTAKKIRKYKQKIEDGQKELNDSQKKNLQDYTNQINKKQNKLATEGNKLTKKERNQLKKDIKTLSKKKKDIEKKTMLSAEEKQAIQNEIETLTKEYSGNLDDIKGMYNTELNALRETKDVKSFEEVVKAQREAAHTAYLLRQGKIAFQAHRGLLPMRAYKAFKSLRTGLKSGKNLDKAAKVVRANTSGLSARINDWLFHNTVKNLPPVAKIPVALQLLNMTAKTIGDMYDVTQISTDKFTNGVDMKPYLLLGADNMEGYEDVVNEGMWLFWAGSSTSAADDDAAFLEAMSFAERFHQDLVEVQDQSNIMACDVDIYVVRPIIRNPGTHPMDNKRIQYSKQ